MTAANNQASTIEMVTFKPKAGVSPAQVQNHASALNDFLHQQSGFIYRSLSELDGLWYDIVYWNSPEAAKLASEKFMHHPAGQAMMEIIDSETTAMRHMPALVEVMARSS